MTSFFRWKPNNSFSLFPSALSSDWLTTPHPVCLRCEQQLVCVVAPTVMDLAFVPVQTFLPTTEASSPLHLWTVFTQRTRSFLSDSEPQNELQLCSVWLTIMEQKKNTSWNRLHHILTSQLSSQCRRTRFHSSLPPPPVACRSNSQAAVLLHWLGLISI